MDTQTNKQTTKFVLQNGKHDISLAVTHECLRKCSKSEVVSKQGII